MANIIEVSSDEESFFGVNLESPKAEKSALLNPCQERQQVRLLVKNSV